MSVKKPRRGPAPDLDLSWSNGSKRIKLLKARKQAEIDLYNSLCGPVTVRYVEPKLTDSTK